MKARVRATGDIFEVSDTTTIYPEHYDKSYNITEVEFLDVYEKSFPKDEDYWTRLEHQYAGMVMQSILQTMPGVSDPDKYMKAAIDLSAKIAHALVEKMKEADR